MGWVTEMVSAIGMQRLLQDMIDELSLMPDREPYIDLLIQELEQTLVSYRGRHLLCWYCDESVRPPPTEKTVADAETVGPRRP